VITQVNLKGDIELSNTAGIQGELEVYTRTEDDISKSVREISAIMEEILWIGKLFTFRNVYRFRLKFTAKYSLI
jgi:hypothetical protein